MKWHFIKKSEFLNINVLEICHSPLHLPMLSEDLDGGQKSPNLMEACYSGLKEVIADEVINGVSSILHKIHSMSKTGNNACLLPNSH